MTQLWAFLAAAVWPLAKKVLASLGIGFLTYEGLTAIGSQVQSAVISSWGSIGGATIQILNLAGATSAVGILLSAITAKVALVAIGRIGKVTA